MPREDFVGQLKSLGYVSEDRGNGRITFQYIVPSGRFASQEITLGFIVHDDFNLNPPGGLHVSPRLLPQHPSNDLPHPAGGVHESPFGPDWQYWSRPLSHWTQTDRTVRAVLAHVRRLFDTQ
jgi:hypothetical protein